GVDDDDEVTGVDVRGERRLVFATQQRGGLAGQAAEDDVGGVDDEPLAGDVARLGSVGTHGKEAFVAGIGQGMPWALARNAHALEGAHGTTPPVYGAAGHRPNRVGPHESSVAP